MLHNEAKKVDFLMEILLLKNLPVLEFEPRTRLLKRMPNRSFCYLSIMTSVTRLCDLLDFGQLFNALATINLPKSPTLLGNICKGIKIFHFSNEIVLEQIL